MLDFKNKVKHTLFYKEYDSKEIFPFELKDHLIEWMFDIYEKMRPKDEKKEILKKFFDLGIKKGSTSPSTLIIYPRSDQEIADPTHLLPYMVLEDFQAIHKITKCLNIAGYENVHSSSLDLYEKAREKRLNEIFLCLPRNKPAQECLEGIPERRFDIEPFDDPNKKSWKIIWKLSSGKSVSVISPQTKYLLKQRNCTEGRWKENPGMCYAVVARFKSRQAEETLKKLKKF